MAFLLLLLKILASWPIASSQTRDHGSVPEREMCIHSIQAIQVDIYIYIHIISDRLCICIYTYFYLCQIMCKLFMYVWLYLYISMMIYVERLMDGWTDRRMDRCTGTQVESHIRVNVQRFGITKVKLFTHIIHVCRHVCYRFLIDIHLSNHIRRESERERERDVDLWIYIHTYISTYSIFWGCNDHGDVSRTNQALISVENQDRFQDVEQMIVPLPFLCTKIHICT